MPAFYFYINRNIANRDIMQANIREQLLELNRQFYTTVAPHFNQTRMSDSPGLIKLLNYLPECTIDNKCSIADIGCGNGRLAWLLERVAMPWHYVGADADEQLLTLAQQNTAQLTHVQPHFVTIDLAQQGWSTLIRKRRSQFDCITCLATMHHLPSYELRLQVLQEMASLLKSDGQIILSFWQFLASERLVKRQINWETIGMTEQDVEPRDVLLPWKQGTFAIRYAHQVDEDELEQLIYDAGLNLIEIFRADGHTNNLNLYARLSAERRTD